MSLQDDVTAWFRERIPAVDEQGVILSSHCHDDLGLAAANSLAAIQAGARQVEGARLALASGYGLVAYRHGARANAVVLEAP